LSTVKMSPEAFFEFFLLLRRFMYTAPTTARAATAPTAATIGTVVDTPSVASSPDWNLTDSTLKAVCCCVDWSALLLPVLPLVVVVAVVLPLYEAASADGENVSTESEPEASTLEADDSAGEEEAVDEAVEAADE
jgi:hypothetical protein